MQICAACFDEDAGGARSGGCHREGQRDRIGELLPPGKTGPGWMPQMADWLD